MKKKILNNILTIVLIIALISFVLSLSINLPIYFRPFYYLQIKTLRLEENTGYTYSQIKDAYDQLLNYLTLFQPFGTGVMDYSEEGYSHFADCKFLFDLDTIVMIVSFIVIITLIILERKNIIEFKNYFKFPPYFYSSVLSIIIVLVLAIAISIDFDKAFIVFHNIFFPGKTNWVFNSNTDKIIRVLPETFFLNCAILIGSAFFVMNLTLLILGIIKRKKVATLLK